MNVKELVRNKIETLKNDESKLYSYLYDLIYKEIVKDVSFLEKIYAHFLRDQREEIQRISIYALLFGLKIKNHEYKDFAIETLKDINKSIELRLNCISGLSQTYLGSKNKEILSIFYDTYSSFNEDDSIRTECFLGMLKLLGLSSSEIFKKNANKVIITMDHIDENRFADNLQSVKSIIRN